MSALFPDLSVAFRGVENNAAKEAETRAAEEEAQRRRKEEEGEQARRQAEDAAAMAAKEKAEAQAREAAERAEQDRLEKEREQQAAAEAEAARIAEEQAAAEQAKTSNGGNQSSTQLKMMLGLPAEAQNAGEVPTPNDKVEGTTAAATPKKAAEKRYTKAGNKKSQNRAPEAPAAAPAEQPAPKPAAAAWGGAAKSKPKKSMSEIQQEEARAAAMMAMQRDNMPRQSSSGWANVAATGSTGWSSGTLKQTPAAVVPNANMMPGARPGQHRTGKTQPSQVPGGARKVAPVTQQRSSSTASSTPADEFGASMSPVLEKWCKDQMQKINGSDDLTLVAFCMTLDDANEVRQYLTTYLGSTPQVNSFATEFINKRGLGSNKQEEWETPGSAKKGRKKKAGGR